jgi:hypothetical protein
MGIELKTGHNQNPQHTHMAQLALYSVALRARYGSFKQKGIHQYEKIESIHNELIGSGAGKGGMLLYLNSENFNAVHISPDVNELKSLLSHRNYVAAELRKATAPRGIVIEYDNESMKQNMDSSRR